MSSGVRYYFCISEWTWPNLSDFRDAQPQTSGGTERGQHQDCTLTRLRCEVLSNGKAWIICVSVNSRDVMSWPSFCGCVCLLPCISGMEGWFAPRFREIVSCTDFYPGMLKKCSRLWIFKVLLDNFIWYQSKALVIDGTEHWTFSVCSWNVLVIKCDKTLK